MIYEMECSDCKAYTTICCSIGRHETEVKPGLPCRCGGTMRQIFTQVKAVFAREGFPKNDPRWEHASNDGVPIRDKAHLRDVCQENGNISRYLEDAV